MLPPPVANIFDSLYFVSLIDSTDDAAPADNYNIVRQEVTGAYDPNDKQENFGGFVSLPELAEGKFLNYRIRFQNTGNDTAFTVVIRDTLCRRLDPDSMYVIETSHPATVKIVEGNIVEAKFNNIRLVDSVHNEPESHGFISFRIKPRPGLQVGDTVSNKASIYFDYNPPIVTNEALTIVTQNFAPPPPPPPVDLFELVSFSATLENSQVRISWQASGENLIEEYEVEHSTDGLVFTSISQHTPESGAGPNSYAYLHSTPVVGSNFYRLKIVRTNTSVSYSEIKEVIIDQVPVVSVPFSVYPNPARDAITININSDLPGIAGLKVTDAKGSTIYRHTLALQQGSTTHVVSSNNWPAGIYYVEMVKGKKKSVIQVLKR